MSQCYIYCIRISKYTLKCQVSERDRKFRICNHFDLFDVTKGQNHRHFDAKKLRKDFREVTFVKPAYRKKYKSERKKLFLENDPYQKYCKTRRVDFQL